MHPSLPLCSQRDRPGGLGTGPPWVPLRGRQSTTALQKETSSSSFTQCNSLGLKPTHEEQKDSKLSVPRGFKVRAPVPAALLAGLPLPSLRSPWRADTRLERGTALTELSLRCG